MTGFGRRLTRRLRPRRCRCREPGRRHAGRRDRFVAVIRESFGQQVMKVLTGGRQNTGFRGYGGPRRGKQVLITQKVKIDKGNHVSMYRIAINLQRRYGPRRCCRAAHASGCHPIRNAFCNADFRLFA